MPANLPPAPVYIGAIAAMNDAAKTVMSNMLLAAIARMMLIVGTPVIIGILTWFAGSFVTLQQLVAIQAMEQARIVTEVRDLQEYRRDAFARGAAMTQNVASIKEMIVRLQHTMDGIKR